MKIPCEDCICLAICKADVSDNKIISSIRRKCYILDDFLYKTSNGVLIKTRIDRIIKVNAFFGTGKNEQKNTM